MKPNSATTADILSKQNQYVVPVFQRFYRWERPQWDKLWENLMELRTPESVGRHFMGFLVFFPQTTAQLDQRLHVIDGQQRLTTISLLLIAIRDAAEEKGFNDLAREVTERYLVDPLREGAEHFRILLKLRDRREYEAAVNGEQAPDGRITAALSYFESRLTELPELSEAGGLRQFLALVTRRLEFMCATLEEDNAYNIFKSLNSTGVPLGAADLIRNFVFMNLRPELHDEFDERLWMPLERHFTRRNGVIDDDTLSAFMRDFLMRDGRLLRKEKEKVFEAFEDRYMTMGFSPQTLATELNRFAEYYMVIRGERLDRDERVTAAVDNVNSLKVSTSYPLLLQLFERRGQGVISDEQLAKAIESLVGFILRRYVCGLDARAYGKTFTKACASLGASTLETLYAYLLQNEYPADSRFKSAFIGFNLYGSPYGRFVLESFERSRGHREPANLAGADVEHIMPQTLTPQWRHDLGAEADRIHAKWLHTPGNLTLSAYNQALANRTFGEKRQHYAHSNIGMTRELASLERWSEAEIQRRGESMAEIAAKLWVGPSEPFVAQPSQGGTRVLNPEEPGSLFYTHIIEGYFGSARVSNWRELVDCAVRTSSQNGVPFSILEQIAGAQDQNPGEGHFRQIEGTSPSLWVRGMDANQCWQRSFRLAQRANAEIKALVEWENTEAAAHPGERAVLQWSPKPTATSVTT
jgi:uncharacterized protein with ParB-like and HNH nuclease domain